MVLKITTVILAVTGMLATGCATKPKVAEQDESGYGPTKLGVAEEKNFFGYKIQQIEKPDGSTAELIWY